MRLWSCKCFTACEEEKNEKNKKEEVEGRREGGKEEEGGREGGRGRSGGEDGGGRGGRRRCSCSLMIDLGSAYHAIQQNRNIMIVSLTLEF